MAFRRQLYRCSWLQLCILSIVNFHWSVCHSVVQCKANSSLVNAILVVCRVLQLIWDARIDYWSLSRPSKISHIISSQFDHVHQHQNTLMTKKGKLFQLLGLFSDLFIDKMSIMIYPLPPAIIGMTATNTVATTVRVTGKLFFTYQLVLLIWTEAILLSNKWFENISLRQRNVNKPDLIQ